MGVTKIKMSFPIPISPSNAIFYDNFTKNALRTLGVPDVLSSWISQFKDFFIYSHGLKYLAIDHYFLETTQFTSRTLPFKLPFKTIIA